MAVFAEFSNLVHLMPQRFPLEFVMAAGVEKTSMTPFFRMSKSVTWLYVLSFTHSSGIGQTDDGIGKPLSRSSYIGKKSSPHGLKVPECLSMNVNTLYRHSLYGATTCC